MKYGKRGHKQLQEKGVECKYGHNMYNNGFKLFGMMKKVNMVGFLNHEETGNIYSFILFISTITVNSN